MAVATKRRVGSMRIPLDVEPAQYVACRGADFISRCRELFSVLGVTWGYRSENAVGKSIVTSVAEPVRGRQIGELDFRALFDSFPAAVYTTDVAGYITYYNKAAEDLAGHSPRIGHDKWCVSWRLLREDGTELPHDQCPMATALREGRAIRNVSAVAERPDGTRIPFMPFPTPLFDADGELIGAVNMLVDISALKAIEATSAHRADEQAALYRFTDRLYRANTADEVVDAALEAIFTGLRCSRAAILMFNEDGLMEFVAARGLSAEYRKAVTGHTPWKPGEQDPQPILIEDFEATDEPEALKAVIRKEGVRGLAFIPLVASGGVVGKFMVYHDKPHVFDEAECYLALTIARQLGFALERQRAREYRANAEDARRLLSSIVANSDDAIISKDLNGIINSWNQGAQRLFGYAPEEIIGRSVLTLIPPELQHEEPGIINRIRSGERIEHYETVRRHKDGSRLHISLTVSPVKDANGRIVGASKIARDITERKRADDQRTLLINELNHRVKNTLATVQSLAMQTLRNTERSEDARELFDSRLAALSRAHDLLTAQHWEGAALYDVVKRALLPFFTDAARISIGGPSSRLTPQQALALSIALHELATNAAKYGALSNQTGRVDVRWTIDRPTGQDMLTLEWIESGGPEVHPPTRSGFGTRLIQRGLANELDGSAVIEYARTGVEAKIVTPIGAQHHRVS
jgi:PAS domain S-box-containing protein